MTFTGVGCVKIFFVATLILHTVESHINQHRGESEEYKRDKRNVNKEIEDYLTRFGYLPQSDLETGALRTMKQLKDAIRWVPISGKCLCSILKYVLYLFSQWLR